MRPIQRPPMTTLATHQQSWSMLWLLKPSNTLSFPPNLCALKYNSQRSYTFHKVVFSNEGHVCVELYKKSSGMKECARG